MPSYWREREISPAWTLGSLHLGASHSVWYTPGEGVGKHPVRGMDDLAYQVFILPPEAWTLSSLQLDAHWKRWAGLIQNHMSTEHKYYVCLAHTGTCLCDIMYCQQWLKLTMAAMWEGNIYLHNPTIHPEMYMWVVLLFLLLQSR